MEMFEPALVERTTKQNQLRSASLRIGPVTLVLIVLRVIVAIWSKLGDNDDALDRLFMTTEPRDANGIRLPEIVHGEVCRLLTPAFIHFGREAWWTRDVALNLSVKLHRLQISRQLFARLQRSGRSAGSESPLKHEYR